jgi:prefoldin subunit 5
MDGDEVMASVDADEYVIADISEDEAWVSIGVQDAPDVRDWR